MLLSFDTALQKSGGGAVPPDPSTPQIHNTYMTLLLTNNYGLNIAYNTYILSFKTRFKSVTAKEYRSVFPRHSVYICFKSEL